MSIWGCAPTLSPYRTGGCWWWRVKVMLDFGGLAMRSPDKDDVLKGKISSKCSTSFYTRNISKGHLWTKIQNGTNWFARASFAVPCRVFTETLTQTIIVMAHVAPMARFTWCCPCFEHCVSAIRTSRQVLLASSLLWLLFTHNGATRGAEWEMLHSKCTDPTVEALFIIILPASLPG